MLEKLMKKLRWRIVRRFGVVFIAGGISGLVVVLTKYKTSDVESAVIITMITAILVALEKGIRDYQTEKEKRNKL